MTQPRTTADLKVGDKFWYVPSPRNGAPREVEIAKIGRVWITETGRNPLRFDRETLEADGNGYASPGRAYLSVEAHAAHRDRLAAWARLCKAVTLFGPVPPGATLDWITEALKTLGVEG